MKDGKVKAGCITFDILAWDSALPLVKDGKVKAGCILTFDILPDGEILSTEQPAAALPNTLHADGFSSCPVQTCCLLPSGIWSLPLSKKTFTR